MDKQIRLSLQKKIVFTLFNVISLYAMTTVGIGIDPNSINEFVAGTIIETYGNETLNFV